MADDDKTEEDETSDGNRRFRDRVAARFRVKFKSLDDLVVTYTHDISQGGLYVKTDKFLPIGTVVQLRVDIPDDLEPAPIIARVAYSLGPEEASKRGRSPGMGMEFLDATGGEVADRISAYLSKSLGSETTEAPSVTPASVLVVDDSDNYREQLEEVMTGLGHRVMVAKNGLEGLGIAIRETPDLILSDVNMPVMDGWQFLRMVRARPSIASVPFVFLTTLSGESERLKGYQLGVDDYIAKPFEGEEVALRANRILDRVRRRPNSSASRNALRGDLSQVSLGSVLSFVQVERRTGVMLLIHGSEIASLHIREGDIVQVDLPSSSPEREGMHRVFELLDWSQGQFEFSTVEVSVADSIGVPTGFILMEHARRTDEGLGA